MPKIRAFTVSPLPFEVQASLQALGQRIVAARSARGLKQAELAEMLGISRQTMSFIENGKPAVQIGHYVRALWLLDITDVSLHWSFPLEFQEGGEL